MLTAGCSCEIKLAYICTKYLYLYICTNNFVHLYQQFRPTSSWPPVTIQPLVDLAAFSRPCLKCSQMSWDTLKLLAPPITDIRRPGEKRVNPRNKETMERARNCFQLWSVYKKPWKSSPELPTVAFKVRFSWKVPVTYQNCRRESATVRRLIERDCMFSGWRHLYKRPHLSTKCLKNHTQQTDLPDIISTHRAGWDSRTL